MTAAPAKAFAAAPAIDPISVEVIGSALSSIVDEMGEALVRASYSTNIKERRDCSTALFDTAGNTLCQAEHIPIHLGSFIGLIPHIMKRFPAESLQPGDVFIGNDPYEGGGTHLPDIVLAEPIFVEGELTAWAVNLAHHADFVDRGHKHIYQEGLRIPPVRLYRAGVLQEDVQNLILLNCQVPHERLSDLRAQTAANRVGVSRMIDLCRKYGRQTVLAAGAALQDYAERKMRAGIAAIPDGTYRFHDVFDTPEIAGLFELAVELTVKGDEMEMEFTSPPQLAAGLNLTYTALLATVFFAVKCVVDPTVLPNSGLARPLTVRAKSRTLLNCALPAAVDARIGACQRVVDLVHGALAQAVPDRVAAASNGSCTYAQFIGTDPETGRTWIYIETIGGGGGARPNKDGLDGIQVSMTNTSNLPVEAMEPEYPLTLLRYELVNESGGEGQYRGGMGIRRVYRSETHCRVRLDGSRINQGAWGLKTGLSGGRCAFHLTDAEFDGHMAVLKPGSTVEIVSPGGGGYGSPDKRPKTAVARDIAERRIGLERALLVYGEAAKG